MLRLRGALAHVSERPVLAGSSLLGMIAYDPKPSATVLRTGHRNRLSPPFNLR